MKYESCLNSLIFFSITTGWYDDNCLVLKWQFSQCGRKFSLKHDKLLQKKQKYLQSEIMRTTLEIKDKYQGKIANRKCLKVQGVNTIFVRAVIAIQSMVGNVRIMWWLWPSRSSNGSANVLPFQMYYDPTPHVSPCPWRYYVSPSYGGNVIVVRYVWLVA